jgi:tetratricopeptide (TPR) repeat protein
METMIRLDQMAGKAIMDRMRLGRLRAAVHLANVYLDCWSRQGEMARSAAFASRLKTLRQIPCFVPLVVFETEGRIDGELAKESLASCPVPAARPASGDPAAGRAWAEEVRRRMHLVAAFQSPDMVLEEAELWLGRMKDAGILAADGNARWAHVSENEAQGKPGTLTGQNQKPPQSQPGPGEALEGQVEGLEPEGAAGDAGLDAVPDPVFAVRVLAAGAAVASGSLQKLVAAFGGEQAACSSMFLAALGFLQAVNLPREAALPMILRALVGRAPLDVMMDLSRRASKAYGDRPCAVQALVSSLALTSASSATVDAVVNGGGVDRLVELAAAAPSVIGLRGSPQTRAAILQKLVGQIKDTDRIVRLCQLGDVRIETGETDAALAAFADVLANAAEPRLRICAIDGRVRALVLGGRAADKSFVDAAIAWLKLGPAAREVLIRIMEPDKDALRAETVKAFAGAVVAKDAPGRQVVLDALQKVVDEEPGSGAAAAALKVLDASGYPDEAEARVTWALIAGRHHVVAGQAVLARSCFERAFAGLKPGMESASEGVTSLLRWAAADARYGWLDQLVPAARKAGIVTVESLANIAGILGEAGEHTRARKFVALAQALKPSKAQQWVSLADAASRFGDVKLATMFLGLAGPEESWDDAAWEVKGKIASLGGQYREAVVIWAKLIQRRPGDCQPRFLHGLALMMIGDPEGAESDFRACVDEGKQGGQMLGAMAYAQFDQSRFDDAEVTFRLALARDDRAADNHLGLAMVQLRKGLVEAAIASRYRAVELEPLLAKGAVAAARKGYVYSEIQKKAWEELDVELKRQKGGKKSGGGGRR